MTDLFWPGDHRAGQLMSDRTFLAAMVAVEQAWLDSLVDARIAATDARTDLARVITDEDLESIACDADADGNPAAPVVALLRKRTAASTARWLHRGLTSQDVIDTALILCVRDVLAEVADKTTRQIHSLIELIEKYRATETLARTLTQAALPSTLGVRFAHWLDGIVDAAQPLRRLQSSLPVQVGGAVGTLAASTELTGSVDDAIALGDTFADALGLSSALPWHTTRSPITRIGDALTTCCDAWGHIATDVATGSRTEIGELTEGGGGGSSTMPHKRNPVHSVLIRRTALTVGPLAATLHSASATSVDERADGAWHAEWATLRTLARRTVVAAIHTSELLAGLQVHEGRIAANLNDADGTRSEQRTMAELTGRPTDAAYLGAAQRITDATLTRARNFLKERQ